MKDNSMINIYDDSVVAIGMIETDKDKNIFHIAMKYVAPQSYNKLGEVIEITNVMEGETNWFILPHTFAVGIVKILIELKVSGMYGFNDEGFQKMLNYFIDMEDINDSISY